jgi:hypothetical protein
MIDKGRPFEETIDPCRILKIRVQQNEARFRFADLLDSEEKNAAGTWPRLVFRYQDSIAVCLVRQVPACSQRPPHVEEEHAS